MRLFTFGCVRSNIKKIILLISLVIATYERKSYTTFFCKLIKLTNPTRAESLIEKKLYVDVFYDNGDLKRTLFDIGCRRKAFHLYIEAKAISFFQHVKTIVYAQWTHRYGKEVPFESVYCSSCNGVTVYHGEQN